MLVVAHRRRVLVFVVFWFREEFPKQKKVKGEREKYSPSTNSSSLSFVAVRVVIFLYHARHHKHTYHLSLSRSLVVALFLRAFFLSLFSLQKRPTDAFRLSFNFLCSDWKFSMREYN